MKKLILPLLLLVAFGMLAAVESDPSDVVGYFKKNIAAGDWRAISLPFGYEVGQMSPDLILGQQFGDLDQLINMSTNENAMYLDGVGWIGTMDQMTYGHGFWLNRDAANPQLDYFILGKVDPNPVTIFVAGDPGLNWSAFALNEATPISVTSLNITGAVDLDVIIDIENNENAMYLDGVGWIGTLETIKPTHVYWYNSFSPTNFTWTYTPTPPSPTRDGNSGTSFTNSKSK